MAHNLPPQPNIDLPATMSISNAFSDTSLPPPPPPPAHRQLPNIHTDPSLVQRHRQSDPNNYSDYTPPDYTPSDITPDSASLRERTGGEINGLAFGAPGQHDGGDGLQALRNIRSAGHSRPSLQGTPFSDRFAHDSRVPPRLSQTRPSYGSMAPLAAGASTPGGIRSPNSSQQSMTSHYTSHDFSDSPYNRFSLSNLHLNPQMGQINPNDVADDDDWGMAPTQQQKRRSFVPFMAGGRENTPNASTDKPVGTVGVAAAAAPTHDASGQYKPVPTAEGSQPDVVREKSEWLHRHNRGRKKLMWIVSAVIAFLVIGAIVGGVLGSVLHGGGSGDSKQQDGANAVVADNKDDLSINSDEIKKLMNNANLHKVFPGMDYTPLNSQYPDCMHVPPSQNNITRDMAVMSQLTNAVRLYGTDCNQTQMVLHSIDRLQLTDMKIWLGVWLGSNDTTNSRQVAQMWDIIDNYGADKFKGVIVGNEVLYNKSMTETALLKYIVDIRTNLTAHSISLPVSTSDLGDNWSGEMATQVDAVMSNIHPFFAGVTAKEAAAWTWNFWQNHDVVLTASNKNITQIISEVGWPSAGGNDCGAGVCTSSTDGSVAGISEMNQFMSDWICPSLKNGTEYFWFSAFDEPWKIIYNTEGQNWEDKWGLMDVNRNLKSGLTIPDCDGQTVS